MRVLHEYSFNESSFQRRRSGLSSLFILFIIVLISGGVLAPAPPSPSVSQARNRNNKNTFDFIIVGGGTAGCVLAHRLSENGNFTVLVLEAGGVPPEAVNIPALQSTFIRNPNVTFQYYSAPQKRAALKDNGVIRIPVGRALGGTSNINAMRINRGSPLDFDNWAQLTGDESWRYSNMLQYFKKSESYRGEFPSDQHGFEGPITVSEQKFVPGREAWLAAGRELGYKIWDPNGPQKISFTPAEYSMKFGRRVSSYVGYLKPIQKSRENLEIVTNAFVTEVLFDGNQAIGVKYVTNSTRNPTRTGVYFARKEVILSSGTYGSPTLLLRSGIGPREVLHQARVPLLKELPVGENFQDHPALPLRLVVGNKSLSYDPTTALTRENFELFRKFGEGPYTTAMGYAGQAFVSSSVAKLDGNSDWSDIELSLAAVSTPIEGFGNNTIYLEPWETSVVVYIYLTRPKSRGTVKLNPKDINGGPMVDFNYFDDPLDEQVFLDAIKVIMELFEQTETYKRLGARYPSEPMPACRKFRFRSEAYWRCYVRQQIFGGYHPSSTCSMNSVVDSKLSVIGMKRLRVVDGSIMPAITNANLQAAIYGIAEKAADSILLDWTA